ncbi:hypothetical protein PUNSTDRAFT_44612 [Punctularia strigosozonata HHB-11173 SS5]|uniref:uncharacterized protein n=1 Tax=Punctularia strigosozonata (strain HHB-11173) TaxID=741275 RepID=UPI0004418647|nr:uncharacterized protein PUNSTDRAFT_44612 [Punctularia strigosozonata HHB-11173 SS5]EIN09208.1 hypothetical protein PUNSTDRAFT_44612 [Punctularia strigosozonata HHB-11173 SS5]
MTQRLSSANAQRIIFNVESASLMVRWVLHHDGALEIDLGKAIKAFTDKSLSPLQIEAACGFAVLFSPLALLHKFLLSGRRAVTPLVMASFMQAQKAKPAWLVWTENLLVRRLCDIAAGRYGTLVGLHKFFSDWDKFYVKNESSIPSSELSWLHRAIPFDSVSERLSVKKSSDHSNTLLEDFEAYEEILVSEDNAEASVKRTKPSKALPTPPTRVSERSNKGKPPSEIVGEGASLVQKQSRLRGKGRGGKNEDNSDDEDESDASDTERGARAKSKTIDGDDIEDPDEGDGSDRTNHDDDESVIGRMLANQQSDMNVDEDEDEVGNEEQNDEVDDDEDVGNLQNVGNDGETESGDGDINNDEVALAPAKPKKKTKKARTESKVKRKFESVLDAKSRQVTIYDPRNRGAFWSLFVSAVAQGKRSQKKAPQKLRRHAVPVRSSDSLLLDLPPRPLKRDEEIKYEYRTFRRIAKIEYKLVQDIMGSASSFLKSRNGLQDPATYAEEWAPSVHFCSYNDWSSLEPSALLNIHSKANIVVSDHLMKTVYEVSEFCFCEQLGMKDLVEVQDLALRNINSYGVEHLWVGRDILLEEAQKPIHTGALYNALDIPLGQRGLVDVYGMGILDTGRAAWKPAEVVMERMQLSNRKAFPYDDVSWALVGLADVSTWPHIDAEGAGTMVIVVQGLKLWCMAKPVDPQDDCYDTIDAFAPNYDPANASLDRYKWEAVLLGPGDCLRSVITMVHALFTSTFTTNTYHLGMINVLLRLLPYWCRCYEEEEINPLRCPDLSTTEGLLTLLAVGNVACFYEALIYRGDVDDLQNGRIDVDELATIRFAYQRLMVIVLRNHDVRVANTVGKPSNEEFTVFHAAIEKFAQALLSYAAKERANSRFGGLEYKHNPKLARLIPENIYDQFRDPLEEFWAGQWDHVGIPEMGDALNKHQRFETKIELNEQDITILRRQTPLSEEHLDLTPFLASSESDKQTFVANTSSSKRKRKHGTVLERASNKRVKVILGEE